MAINLETARLMLSQAQSILNEAKEKTHLVGDIVNRARENVKMVAALGDLEGIQNVLVAIEALSQDYHQTMIGKVSQVQALIETSKGTK